MAQPTHSPIKIPKDASNQWHDCLRKGDRLRCVYGTAYRCYPEASQYIFKKRMGIDQVTVTLEPRKTYIVESVTITSGNTYITVSPETLQHRQSLPPEVLRSLREIKWSPARFELLEGDEDTEQEAKILKHPQLIDIASLEERSL